MQNEFVEITVIITTRNRPDTLHRCLTALSQSTFKSFEVIIVDQSSHNHRLKLTPQTRAMFPSIAVFPFSKVGKSIGLNYALENIFHPLAAVIDDDCIPKRDWLEKIVKHFMANPKIDALIGKVLLYQPKNNQKLTCSAYFNPDRSNGVLTASKIGLGCNFAFRFSMYKQLGGFRDLLGPGSLFG
ncbi:MAG: glycosyltransferase family 2 protein, partial [bacterium]|nr:glycosyltransferase family 2 protein [bacterium]